MGKQEIEFIIRPDGTVEERVLGVSGPDCEIITEDIEVGSMVRVFLVDLMNPFKRQCQLFKGFSQDHAHPGGLSLDT